MTKPTCLIKIRALVSAMLINMIVGSVYNYSNINRPISLYFSINQYLCLLVFTLWHIGIAVSSIWSLELAKLVGHRILSSAGFLLWALINQSISFFPQNHKFYAYLYIFGYGILGGLAIGISWPISLYIVWTYFKVEKIPLLSFLISFSFSFGSFIIGPLSQRILRSEKYTDDDPRTYEHVPLLFEMMGFYFLILIFLITVIQPPLRDSSQKAAKKRISIKPEAITPLTDKAENLINNLDYVDISKNLPLRTISEGIEYDCKEEQDLIRKAEMAKLIPKYCTNQTAMVMNLIGSSGTNNLMALEELRTIAYLKPLSMMSEPHIKRETPRDRKTTVAPAYITDRLLRKSLPSTSGEIKNHPISRNDIKQLANDIKNEGPTCLKQVLRSKEYWIIVLLIVLGLLFPLLIGNIWKSFTKRPSNTHLMEEDYELQILLIVSLIATCFGKFQIGIMMICLSLKVSIILLLSLQILAVIATYFIGDYHTYIYMIIVVYSYLFSGACITLYGIIATTTFGPIYGPRLSIYANAIYALSSLFQWIILYLWPTSVNIDYLFIVFGILVFGALITTIFYKINIDWPTMNKRYADHVKSLKQKKSKYGKINQASKNIPQIRHSINEERETYRNDEL